MHFCFKNHKEGRLLLRTETYQLHKAEKRKKNLPLTKALLKRQKQHWLNLKSKWFKWIASISGRYSFVGSLDLFQSIMFPYISLTEKNYWKVPESDMHCKNILSPILLKTYFKRHSIHDAVIHILTSHIRTPFHHSLIPAVDTCIFFAL